MSAASSATAPIRKRRRSTKKEDQLFSAAASDHHRLQAVSPPLSAKFAEMTTVMKEEEDQDQDIDMLSDDENGSDELAGSTDSVVSLGGANPLDLLVGVAEQASRRASTEERERERDMDHKMRVKIAVVGVEKKFENGNGGSWAHVEGGNA